MFYLMFFVWHRWVIQVDVFVNECGKLISFIGILFIKGGGGDLYAAIVVVVSHSALKIEIIVQ